MSSPRTNLFDLSRQALAALVAACGFSPVHAGRLWRYLYREGAASLDQMTDLPARLVARLMDGAMIGHLAAAGEIDSNDGCTRKFLLELADGQRIETVHMRFRGRTTACLSTQVGCAMGCGFCATGQMGFTRHLTVGEIVAQAMFVQRGLLSGGPGEGHRLRNIVLMGMGEPLHNYDAVMQALDIVRDPGGLAIAAKRITISTVGVIPGIVRMADERRPESLAVSLHAASQAERDALIPVSKAWPLDELLRACRYYVQQTGQRVFIEWTLIAGTNDSPRQASALASLLRGLPAQVNLIPLNSTAGYLGSTTRPEGVRQFQDILAFAGLPSTVRQRRGLDIAAGCGQLAAGGNG